jgi:ERCC4-type nuclease
LAFKKSCVGDMSGTETLVPYIRERDKEQPIIIVDTREASASPKIVKGLREKGAGIVMKALPKGDYVLSDSCAVERKTVHDFIYTLTRRHLFEQLFKLQEVYEKPFILIEGYLPIIYKFSRIQPSSVWGAMFFLARRGIAMIHTTSYKETVDFLHTAARQEQIVEKRAPVVHPVKKTETLTDAQIFFMASLPNIGRERALSILNAYQTPMNALLNMERWGKDVHGLGPKITEKARQVLHKPYKERETA